MVEVKVASNPGSEIMPKKDNGRFRVTPEDSKIAARMKRG